MAINKKGIHGFQQKMDEWKMSSSVRPARVSPTDRRDKDQVHRAYFPMR